MINRVNKIYTKAGDDGTTSFCGGVRVEKDHPCIATCGTVDELNASIGVLLSYSPLPIEIQEILNSIQHELYDLCSELSVPGRSIVTEEYVVRLETFIDWLEDALPPLQKFILPQGSLSSVYCHQARTICRRAERCLVQLKHQVAVNPFALQYLNRLSDLLFVIARFLLKEEGKEEAFWRGIG